MLGPVASDLVIFTMLLLVYLIVFDRWINRMVPFISLATAFTEAGAHHLLPPGYSEVPIRLIYHSALILLLGFATIVILRNIFKQRIFWHDCNK